MSVNENPLTVSTFQSDLTRSTSDHKGVTWNALVTLNEIKHEIRKLET